MSTADALLARLEAAMAIEPKAPDVKDKLRLLDGLLSEIETFVSAANNDVRTREEVAAASSELSRRLETLRRLS
jgi:hypothetical protein